MTMWTYKGKTFTEKMIPENAVGFIYIMIAKIGGKERAYIGKKNFYSETKKKFTKKQIAAITDNRLKKYTLEKKLNYENYFSSNKILKEAQKKGAAIKREILVICFSPTELTYQEVKHQFVNNVLETDYYLNENILGKFYKTK